MYHKDWSLKPSGEAICELLLKTWCIDVDGMTGAEGTFSTCGYLGEYMTQVSTAAKTISTNVQLKRGGSDVGHDRLKKSQLKILCLEAEG